MCGMRDQTFSSVYKLLHKHTTCSRLLNLTCNDCNNDVSLVACHADVEQVFLQLLPDIPDLLLFLKNLREVKLCIIPEGSQDAIVLSTSVRVDNPLPDISLPAGWECSKKVIKTTTLEQKQPSSGLLSDAQKTISSERAWFRILDDKAAVAILLNNELPLVGQIYCGMPLPISKTNLVVHINGNVFLPMCSRRTYSSSVEYVSLCDSQALGVLLMCDSPSMKVPFRLLLMPGLCLPQRKTTMLYSDLFLV